MNIPKRIYTVFIASVTLWCLLILAAPLLRGSGSSVGEIASNILYTGFSRICHQLDSRSFHLLGAKFGVCVRCTSIYFSFFVGVALYPFLRRLKSASLPSLGWMVLALGPMVLDVLMNDLGILDSTSLSRVVTGSVSGFVFAFFIVPVFVEATAHLIYHRTLQGDSPYAGKTQ